MPVSEYGNASYKGVNKGLYLKDWLIAGPFFISENKSAEPDLQTQEAFFNADRGSMVKIADKKFIDFQSQGKSFTWQPHHSSESTINLNQLFKEADYALAYALAEIKSDSACTVFLALGSDDAIKVWLNGAVVHKNFNFRSLTPDQDLVPVNLVKGSNQLLLQVQDGKQGWGFTARLLDRTSLSGKFLTNAVVSGDVQLVTQLLKGGADPNSKAVSGLTALNIARLAGRDEIEKLLLSYGAKSVEMPAPSAMLDSLYGAGSSRKTPGVAILVSQDGKILYKKGFQFADLEAGKTVQTDTRFRIGSITKQFTASAILKLQEDGKLQVSDKLSKYFPDFPRGDEVTLHHLLTHTSGIHSYTGKEDFLTRVTSTVKDEDLLQYFKNDPYDFNPGDDYRYNNSGYFLLGYIVEKVSGKPYGQYLKETFFDPLGMKHTGVHRHDLVLENEAKGYSKTGDTYQRALNWDMSWAAGAGVLYSTVEDLVKWNEAVFNGKVLKEKSLALAITPVTLNNNKPSPVKYGYGWIVSNYRGQPVIEHSGGLHGFISQLCYYPKEKLTIVMLTNQAPAEVDMNPNKIAEIFLWDKMDKQKSLTENRSVKQDLKAFEGRYDFTNGAVMIITTDGTDLFAQLTGQPKFQIYPSNADEFFWKVVEAKIHFLRDEKGTVTSAHFKQGQAELTVPKLPEEKIVTLDPAVFLPYVGNYDLQPGVQVSVTTSDKRFFVQATNQPKFEILPLSDTVFLLREVNAKLTFVRNSEGKVDKFLLDMGGQKKEVKRIE